MIYGEDLLELLADLQPSPYEGEVYRHMFGAIPPARENIVGARWNPEELPTIYTSVEESTAAAEGDYRISMEPFRPKVGRRLHRIRVRLSSVIDLRDWAILEKLGVKRETYLMAEPLRCKEVGGAVAHLGHDGLLVPSARSDGTSLVIYANNKTSDYEFSLIDFSIVD